MADGSLAVVVCGVSSSRVVPRPLRVRGGAVAAGLIIVAILGPVIRTFVLRRVPQLRRIRTRKTVPLVVDLTPSSGGPASTDRTLETREWGLCLV